MNENSITRMRLEDVAKRRARGEVGQSDWARLDGLSESDIEASTRDDPDWQDFADIDWSKALPAPAPLKTAVSIRLDHDVLDFFKKDGRGYQSRINAVLRHYMLVQQGQD